jgi:release factor glutamine methyltransferase
MTTNELYNHFLNRLKNIYEEREASNITDWVFENVMNLKKWERRENASELNTQQISQLKQYLDELLQHKPVQYVLNEAWFYKMKFYVNEDVLIPRPETEELVEWIIHEIRGRMFNPSPGKFNILDIGTGSGCIAISLKKELVNINVTAIDVSQKALAVADKNAQDLQAKIDFINFNFLYEEQWDALSVYDIIVSNPPYIPEDQKTSLSKIVTDFEPAIALFVDDSKPFIFYEKIAKFAQSHLKASGRVFVEIHENYSNKIEQVFKDYNFETEIKKDIYGKERMIKAEK